MCVVPKLVKYAAGCMLGYIPGVEMYHLTCRTAYSRNAIITYIDEEMPDTMVVSTIYNIGPKTSK